MWCKKTFLFILPNYHQIFDTEQWKALARKQIIMRFFYLLYATWQGGQEAAEATVPPLPGGLRANMDGTHSENNWRKVDFWCSASPTHTHKVQQVKVSYPRTVVQRPKCSSFTCSPPQKSTKKHTHTHKLTTSREKTSERGPTFVQCCFLKPCIKLLPIKK